MEKSEYKELKEQLLSTKKNGYDILGDAARAAMEDYCGGYKRFLDASKTERRCGNHPPGGSRRLSGFYAGHGREPWR